MENSIIFLCLAAVWCAYWCAVLDACMIGYDKWWEPLVVAAVFPIYAILKFVLITTIGLMMVIGAVYLIQSLLSVFI
ncbi:hypothetical protein [Undibacterium macrobrachii]|uniref:Uncharacterized protein n=1 Tax=Undibacterium macrobrachii TaxID=1119058 RepID=A0ABQ2XF68_9BURK|nr:hypothetical protein [Undibacterium macrobrachii]GGX14072.1 hypothetical protein GCM10011282_20240 [Undibacterium macrobrachii]